MQLQEQHALTEQQFKILYRSKYLPLKEEHDRCGSEMLRLRDSRAAALEANEKWRAQACFYSVHSCKRELSLFFWYSTARRCIVIFRIRLACARVSLGLP